MDWNAVLSIAAVCLVVGMWTVVIVRLLRERLARSKTVTGMHFHDRAVNPPSGIFHQTQYIVSFSANETVLRLTVSPISYDGYRIGQTGRLTYRGSRVPDWQP